MSFGDSRSSGKSTSPTELSAGTQSSIKVRVDNIKRSVLFRLLIG